MSGDELNPFWTGEDSDHSPVKNRILSLVPKEEKEEKGYIEIEHDDGFKDVLQIDSFGAYDAIPGFIICWRDDPEEIVGFFNSKFIRSIKILKDYDVQKV